MTSNSKLDISVQLFGAFRRAHPHPVALCIEKNTKIKDVKLALEHALRELNPGFNDTELLSKSVLANNQKIYQDEDVISESTTMAILPPVCGG
jgi:molybdopterin converting factor small subunit